MSATWPAKDPDEVLDYSWDVPLDAGDAISGTPTVEIISGGVVAEAPTVNGARVTTFISGGTAGQTAVVQISVTTNGGRTFEESFILPVQASANISELTLAQIKRHLHILHDDDDSQLSDLARQAGKEMLRYVGQYAMDSYASELLIAQIIWVRWRYYVDEQVEIDEITGYPRAFVALAGPYRTPTFS